MKILDRSDSKGLRWFALGLAALLVVVFWGLGPWIAERSRPLWPLVAGWVLVTMAWIWPPSVWPVHRALVPVARLLGIVNTWLLLGLVTGFDADAATYRIRVPSDHRTRLEEPF